MKVPLSDAEPDTAVRPGTLTIGVLMGGCSREREVSLQSGRAVTRGLQSLGHDVRPTDVKPGAVTADLLAGLDVAFLALHGEWGEDGGIQQQLEDLGVCYTFSGPEASRLAMDKVRAKERFSDDGIPTPAFRVAAPDDLAMLEEALDRLGPQLVVKPVADGSSIDIGMADSRASLRRAARKVWARGEPALVERRILGREFTVGILGEMALPLLEIRTPGGWYNYHYKYKSSRTRYVFEHGLPPEREARILEVAVAAHRALDCRDLSRVDVMLPEEGEPQVLEINTIPGFTSHSLVPKAAARAGLVFPKLCERIVAMARRRARRKAGR
ncbi:MAG: D-alanine--D-alanine ligase [Planctomycetota bacterium]|nr:D-alanine--D-alanine ligase [Planctomycetota bacterium]